MKKRFSLVLAAVLAAGTVLTGCGGSDSGSGSGSTTAAFGDTAAAAASTEAAAAGEGADVDTTGFLNAVLNADIQTADVQKTSKDYEVPMNIYDRLVEIKVDESGNSSIEPSLAESWEISDDGLEYTFHLRQGVKFHNGNDFTAEDVLYTFTRMLTAPGTVNSECIDQIKGASELLEGTATELEGVEVVDDYTV